MCLQGSEVALRKALPSTKITVVHTTVLFENPSTSKQVCQSHDRTVLDVKRVPRSMCLAAWERCFRLCWTALRMLENSSMLQIVRYSCEPQATEHTSRVRLAQIASVYCPLLE